MAGFGSVLEKPRPKAKRLKHVKVSLADTTFSNLQKAGQIQGIPEVGAYLHHLAMLDLYGKTYLFEGGAVEADRTDPESP